MKVKLLVCAVASVGLSLQGLGVDASAYVQSGLIAQWDGIENAGAGKHSSSSTLWRDLKGNYDLTVTPRAGDVGGEWGETYLDVAGCSAVGAVAAPDYKTIEVVYRMTDASGKILFCSGDAARKRWVGFDSSGTKAYFNGAYVYAPAVSLVFSAEADCSVAATYNDDNVVSNVYNGGMVIESPKTARINMQAGDGVIMLGDRKKTGANKWYGRIYAIRLYDRILTSEERQRNAAIDNIRFIGDKPDDRLDVTTDPSCAWAVVTPGQEGRSGLTDGQEVLVSATDVSSSDVRATCTGWKLFDRDGNLVGSGDSASFTYRHPNPAAYRRLEWQHDVLYRVTASGVGATYAPVTQWVEKDARAVIAFTPEDGTVFYSVSGDWEALVSGTNLVTGPVRGPLDLTLAYQPQLFVDKDGDDENGTGDADEPFASVGRALTGLAGGPGEIVVGAGDYSIAGEISITTPVRVVGATGNPGDVVFSRSGSGRHFTLDNARALLTGLTLKDAVCKSAGGSVSIGTAGGTVSNCVFSGNSTPNWGLQGGAVYMNSAAALVTHCCFTNNVGGKGDGVPKSGDTCGGGHALCMANGIVRNCLFVGNGGRTLATTRGGTVVMSGGVLESCTFARNADGHCAGARPYKDGAVVRNCVFGEYDCPSAASELEAVLYDAATASRFDHCCSPADINGTCLQSAAPFVDAEHGDWSPAAVIVDKASACDWMTGAGDFAGNPRVSGAAPDIGCLEKDQNQFSAIVSVDATAAIAPYEATFTVTVFGVGDKGVTCHWDWDGDGTWDDTSSGSTSHVYPIGPHVTKVKVVNNATGQESQPDAPFSLMMLPKTIFVDARSATPVPPYQDGDHAATTIADAYEIAVDGCEIVLAEGTYGVSTTLDVTKEVTIRGQTGRPEDVTLKMTSSGTRHFFLNNAQATLAGLTLKDAVCKSAGGSVSIGTAGGTVSNCVFSGNSTPTWGLQGGAVYMDSAAALVTHCCFTNNVGGKGDGVPKSDDTCGGGHALCMANGIVRNCLFVGNGGRTLATTRGGTVVMSGGVLESCTFARNADGHCAGARPYKDGAVVRNCVFGEYDCPSAASELEAVLYDASTSNRFDHCCSPADINGTCLQSAVPFVDAEHGDWSPAAVIVDKASACDWMAGAGDFAGNPRVSGAAPDIGCLEKDQNQFSAIVSVDATAAIAPYEATFTVTVFGVGDKGVTCHWDWDGDGTWDDTSTGSTNHVYSVGPHLTKVKVVNNATGQESQPDAPFSLMMVTKTIFVDARSATPVPPYQDGDHAATSIADAYAIAADGCEIVLAEGTYGVSTTLDVTKEVTIRGQTGRPEDVTLKMTSSKRRHFYLNNAQATLTGLTLMDGTGTGGGGALVVGPLGGVVSNCVFTGNSTPEWSGKGGALAMDSAAALVTHCVFANNVGGPGQGVESTDDCGGGHAVHIAEGVVRNCLFESNGLRTSAKSRGGTVTLAGGVLENCTFALNEDSVCAGVRAYGANAVVRNCLFAEYDCPDAESELRAVVDRASTTNCFDHCCSPADINGTCVVTGEPQFRNPSRNDWRLKARSPAVNAGILSPWMAGATDLSGKPRLFGRKPDIGCFECTSGGLVILVQ